MTPLVRLGAVFLWLGATAFGGPAAHVALMERELVVRRGWLERERFLDLLGAASIIPGPTSTELAIHIGYLRAGWRGLLVAGLSFILPAYLLVMAAAWVYVRFGALPALERVLTGVQPVLLVIVAHALWGLARTACKSWGLGVLCAGALGAAAFGVHELLVLLGAGAALVGARGLAGGARSAVIPPLALAGALGASAAAPSLPAVFLVFLKIGSVLFGSGYVLLAFLRADLVQRLGWIDERQLLDAVAVGQVTPGPLFTTATFIGYLLGGPMAATAATAGIFLPAFVMVALSGPLLPRLRRSKVASAFLDGVNVASVALMALVTWQLARAALVDWRAAAVAIVAAGLLSRTRLGAGWLMLGAALLGLVG